MNISKVNEYLFNETCNQSTVSWTISSPSVAYFEATSGVI